MWSKCAVFISNKKIWLEKPATDQKMPCRWLTAAYINSCVSRANLRICSLAFLSPVDGEPQQPAVESNSSKLISFCPGNLIKHKPFSPLFSVSPALPPYLLVEPLWFRRDVVAAALSMRWAKGTLGTFMIHDEASGIILDVCMCHCILIMASVSWKHQRTFRKEII